MTETPSAALPTGPPEPEQLLESLFALQLKYPDEKELENVGLECAAFIDKHHKLEKAHLEVSLKLSQTLNQFSNILTMHKADRHQLLLISKQRQSMMERTTRHAEASLLMLKENEVLEQTVGKMVEFNRQLMQKVSLLEASLVKEQQFGRSLASKLEHTYGDTELTQQYGKMLKEYSMLMSQNHDIQEEIRELGEATNQNQENVQLFVLLLGLTAEYLPDVLLEMVRSKAKPYCSSLRILTKQQLNDQLFKHFPQQDKESLQILTEELKEVPFSEW